MTNRARKSFTAMLACAALAAMPAHAASSVTIPLPSKPMELSDAQPDKKGVKRMAILRGLDKISGRAIDISAPAGIAVRFGSLIINARYCYTVPPEEPPETVAFLQIDDVVGNQAPKRLFSGWMFASTPAVNGLEHPVYDVWVITCKTEAPAVAGPEAAPSDLPPPPAPPGDGAPPSR
jgi:hypothetical protein